MKTSRKRTFVVALAIAVLAVVSAHAKPINIISCTPTFLANKPGATYDVTANLVAIGDCIDVTAPGITINLSTFSLTGNGTGVGISIKSAKSYVTGPGSIQNFGIGVADMANEARIENLSIANNPGGGVLLSGADGSLVVGNLIVTNGPFGVLLQNTTNSVVHYNQQISQNVVGVWVQNNSTTATVSTHNDVIANEVNQNTFAGIWVGYTMAPGACPAVPPSTFNVIVNNSPVDTNGIGIGLQCNTAQDSTVMHNTVTVANGLDGYDGNAGCATDFWGVDLFFSRNQGCVL